MLQTRPLSVFLAIILLIFCIASCSKSDPGFSSDLVYGKWVYSHSIGRIIVNGNFVGASESSNTLGNTTVEFQRNGQYHYLAPLATDETIGFQVSDSLIILNSDSSFFANFCAFPTIGFFTTPIVPHITLKKVSPELHIEFLRHDSLQVRTDIVKPGVGGTPDTVYREYTGFHKE